MIVHVELDYESRNLKTDKQQAEFLAAKMGEYHARGKKVAIVYSASNTQAEKIYSGYGDNGKPNITDDIFVGKRQAAAFKYLFKKCVSLQMSYTTRVLPISTTVGEGEKTLAGLLVLIRDLRNIFRHLEEGWVVLILTHPIKKEIYDNNKKYQIGGNTAKAFWDEKEPVTILDAEDRKLLGLEDETLSHGMFVSRFLDLMNEIYKLDVFLIDKAVSLKRELEKLFTKIECAHMFGWSSSDEFSFSLEEGQSENDSTEKKEIAILPEPEVVSSVFGRSSFFEPPPEPPHVLKLVKDILNTKELVISQCDAAILSRTLTPNKSYKINGQIISSEMLFLRLLNETSQDCILSVLMKLKVETVLSFYPKISIIENTLTMNDLLDEELVSKIMDFFNGCFLFDELHTDYMNRRHHHSDSSKAKVQFVDNMMKTLQLFISEPAAGKSQIISMFQEFEKSKNGKGSTQFSKLLSKMLKIDASGLMFGYQKCRHSFDTSSSLGPAIHQ